MRRWMAGIVLVAVVATGWFLRGSGAEGPVVEVGAVSRQEVFRSYVLASGELVAERYADIGSSIMGRVVELPVIEGQRIEQGALLARIDPVQARNELAAAEAATRTFDAEARVASDQASSAQADLRLANARQREAQANFDRAEALFDRTLMSRAEFDTAVAALESAQAQVAAAEAMIARVAGSRDAARSRVAQAEAQAARARDLLDKTSIVAPIDGVVSRLQVRQGEMVVIGIQNQPGSVLMTLSDLSELNAEVRVAEADVLRVDVGQTARVTLEALPGKNFTGRVTEVGASALPQTGTGAAAREFRVEVRLDDLVEGMRPGLTGDAEILVGELRDVLTVPLQSVVLRLTGDDMVETRGVFAIEDGRARFIPVQTGIIGGLDIQIEGLAPEALVIVGPYQVLRNLRDGDPVQRG